MNSFGFNLVTLWVKQYNYFQNSPKGSGFLFPVEEKLHNFKWRPKFPIYYLSFSWKSKVQTVRVVEVTSVNASFIVLSIGCSYRLLKECITSKNSSRQESSTNFYHHPSPPPPYPQTEGNPSLHLGTNKIYSHNKKRGRHYVNITLLLAQNITLQKSMIEH